MTLFHLTPLEWVGAAIATVGVLLWAVLVEEMAPPPTSEVPIEEDDVSEMRRKLEAVDQAVSRLEAMAMVPPHDVRREAALSDVRATLARAFETCAREDKARHVRQQRGYDE